jgi:RHS repeat-associated protein
VGGKHSLMRACSRSHVGLDRGAGLPADTGASVASDQLSLVLDRTRFYEPLTGGFTTRDPAFSHTDQAYAYAGDDPVNSADPSGMVTVGECGTATSQTTVLGAVVDGCVTRVLGTDNIGLTGTVGGHLGGGAGQGYGVAYQVSNASDLASLGKWFEYATVAVQYEGGASATLFWSPNLFTDFAHATYGIEFGPNVGGGAESGIGGSYTFVNQLSGIPQIIAIAAWDAMNPSFGTQDVLSRALTSIYAMAGC